MVMGNKFYKERWFFESVMDNIPTAVIVTDLEEVIIYVNGATEELFGYTKDELIGEHSSITNAGPSSVDIQRDISNTITDGGTWHNQILNERKNGELFVLDLKVGPLENEEGTVIGFIGYQKDVTDIKKRKKAETELKNITLELQQINFELEQFAYVASHDLQEPLRVVSNYCEMLRNKCSPCPSRDEETEKWLRYTIEATERMKTLIKELLDFSRVGRKDSPFEYVNVYDTIKEVLLDYEIAIADSDAEIIIEDELPVISAIRSRIKQLLANLLSNSLKFRSEKSPIIRIGCCDEGSFWLFYVKDNGIGIESQYFERVFGIFKRLYSREEYPGTGIGLALCKRIVETHGGKIWVDSDVKNGTWIYFTISKDIKLP